MIRKFNTRRNKKSKLESHDKLYEYHELMSEWIDSRKSTEKTMNAMEDDIFTMQGIYERAHRLQPKLVSQSLNDKWSAMLQRMEDLNKDLKDLLEDTEFEVDYLR